MARRTSLTQVLLRCIKRVTLALVGLEAVAVGALAAYGTWRKHQEPGGDVPPQPPLATQIGESAITVYTNGSVLYDAMLDAIRQAQQRILLDMFIWKGDQVGQAFKDELMRAAERGVEVFVIFDRFANLVVPPRFKRFPTSIHTLQFRVAPPLSRMLDPRSYGRDHHKILVVDRRVAFVGGYNIGSVYSTKWRDTSVGVTGVPVWDLENVFIDFWNMHRRANQPQLDARAHPRWEPRIRVHRNVPRMVMFPIRSMYVEAIDRAQHHIYLTQAYFIPDRTILRALFQAVQRGVDVRLLLPARSNHILADWLAHGFYTRLLKGGVTLLHYDQAMLHAKTATIDGIWSTIGTANIDRLSLQGNYEVNVEVYDTTLAQHMEHLFAADAEHAHEVTLDTWQRRPVIAKVGEAVLSPLWPVL